MVAAPVKPPSAKVRSSTTGYMILCMTPSIQIYDHEKIVNQLIAMCTIVFVNVNKREIVA